MSRLPETQIEAAHETAVSEPPLYRVLLINDDYTPMDFVVWVLENIFHMDHAESVRVMLEVHHRGAGVCGVFPYDIARTKAYQTQEMARKEGHPLQCLVEPENTGRTA